MKGEDKDTLLPLTHLTRYMIDHLDNKLIKFAAHLVDWTVTGKPNKHEMNFTVKIVGSTKEGESYVLSEQHVTCYENGNLTIELPKKSLVLTAEAG